MTDMISGILSRTLVEYFFKGDEERKEKFINRFTEGFAPSLHEYWEALQNADVGRGFSTNIAFLAHRLNKKIQTGIELKQLSVIILELASKKINIKKIELLIQKAILNLA